MAIEPIMFLPKKIDNDSILIESHTGKMYFVNPESFIVPHCIEMGKQKEFEKKLKEFIYKFNGIETSDESTIMNQSNQDSQNEDQNFPMEFFNELDAVFNKWLLPRGKEIPEQLFTICLAYLRSHGWSLRVGHCFDHIL